MNKREDIERAIKHISDNVCFLTRNNGSEESVTAHKLALTALKEKLRGQENVEECGKCRLRGRRWACDNCIWDKSARERTSYFEPKE